MSWSDRQRAMLKEMGLSVAWPGLDAPDAPALGAPREGRAAPSSPPPAQARHDPAVGAQRDSARDTLRDVARGAGPAAAARPPARAPGASPQLAKDPGQALAAPVRQRIEGLEGMDAAQLRQAVAACRACGLCESRTQTVYGLGHEHAHWMIVGEAPGEQEDRQGEPFVGKAGQLLDRMLAALGLTRQPADAHTQVFIANVLKCRPPGNRNPTPEEVAQCEPFLRRQIELVRPRVLLAMGRFAVQSLLATQEPIGRLRGRVHRHGDTPVIVTYHPAYLLRNPADKALAWADLQLAWRVLRDSEQAAQAT